MGRRQPIWRTYISKGREPRVFSAESPEGLPGVHADLISRTLVPEERLAYLLYAPMRDAAFIPFGVRAVPASHGLAVTGHRFILSIDWHLPDLEPAVLSIPFSSILSVSLGQVLLLGWLEIRYVQEGKDSNIALAFHSAGIHHFAAAIRACRKRVRDRTSTGSAIPGKNIRMVPSHDRGSVIELIQLLMVEGEKPLGVLFSSERWFPQPGHKQRICLAPDGIFLKTDAGCLHVVDEMPVRPGMTAYGVQAVCFPPDALCTVTPQVTDIQGVRIHQIRLDIVREGVTFSHDVPYDQGENDSLKSILSPEPEGERG